LKETVRVCLEFSAKYFNEIARHELRKYRFQGVIWGSKDPKKVAVKELIRELLLNYYTKNIKGGEKFCRESTK